MGLPESVYRVESSELGTDELRVILADYDDVLIPFDKTDSSIVRGQVVRGAHRRKEILKAAEELNCQVSMIQWGLGFWCQVVLRDETNSV